MPRFAHGPIHRYLKKHKAAAAQLDYNDESEGSWRRFRDLHDQRLKDACLQCERFLTKNGLFKELSVGRFSKAWLGRTLDAAGLSLVQRGMPSIWVSLMRSMPLPTTTSAPVLEWQAAQRQGIPIDHITVATRTSTSAVKGMAALELVPDDSYCLRSPWLVAALREQLSALLKEAEPMMNDKSRTLMAKKEQALEQLCENTVARLQAIEGGANTLAQLAVLCLCAGFRQREAKFSTLDEYVHRLFQPELLAAPLALNVAEWDASTLDDIKDLVVTCRNWASASWSVFWAALGWFVRYAQSLGYAEELRVPGGGQGNIASIYRSDLLRPATVDRLISDCLSEPVESAAGMDVGLMLALAFYTGLRSGELERLTMADVVFDEREEPVAFSSRQLDELLSATPSSHESESDVNRLRPLDAVPVYINVLTGKTGAARRCVPAHALAPEWVIGALLRYWRERAAGGSRLDKTPLFEPYRVVSGYKMPLTRLAIDALQRRYGNGRDLHLLRHCAASNLALRIHSLMHPAFREQLAEKDHELFSDGRQRLLRSEMENPLGATLWEDGLAYHWMARVLGHSSAETSFRVYVHTAGVIHSDLLWRVFSNHAKRRGESVA